MHYVPLSSEYAHPFNSDVVYNELAAVHTERQTLTAAANEHFLYPTKKRLPIIPKRAGHNNCKAVHR